MPSQDDEYLNETDISDSNYSQANRKGRQPNIIEAVTESENGDGDTRTTKKKERGQKSNQKVKVETNAEKDNKE